MTDESSEAKESLMLQGIDIQRRLLFCPTRARTAPLHVRNRHTSCPKMERDDEDGDDSSSATKPMVIVRLSLMKQYRVLFPVYFSSCC